ncbi:MAG: exodeoxyribonuclease VII large subunit [Rickettsiales bacterium]|jgi:exodeoxyribonuclease VII large subunit|nr:exodeoxyribonuclease VII large subunit [Rickettsiales bacterium]
MLATKLKEYTVSELNNAIKNVFTKDFFIFKVEGEISSFTHHKQSGHFYFQLKDEKTQIGATIWKDNTKNINFEMQNGLKIVATGKLSLWNEKHYIDIARVELKGEGDIFKKFQEKKERLSKEGLLKRINPTDKLDVNLIINQNKIKPIKKLPQKIGIISKIGGAGLQDVIKNLINRTPIQTIKIYDARMQGVGCVEENIKGIEYFNSIPLDCLIITRGGGDRWSDLSWFDDENLARAVFNSNTPIVSAVGHDVDWTLIDYVSDMRLPTPTSVSLNLTISKNEATTRIYNIFKHFVLNKNNRYSNKKVIFTRVIGKLKIRLLKKANRHKNNRDKLYNIFKTYLVNKINKLKQKKNKVKSLNINNIIKIRLLNQDNRFKNILLKILKYEKKYPIILDVVGQIIKFKKQISKNKEYIIKFPDGNVKVMVME